MPRLSRLVALFALAIVAYAQENPNRNVPYTPTAWRDDGYVIHSRDGRDVSISGSVAIRATLPTRLDVWGWGDSMTQGCCGATAYTTPLAPLLNLNVGNGGVGGETSTQIKARMLAATDKSGYVAVIWAGRNNFSSQSTVLADVAAMVAPLTDPARYVVLGVTNANVQSEWSGGSDYSKITALNAALAAAYPINYLDIRAALVAAYNPADAQDVIDHGHDVVPTSLRAGSWAGGTLGGNIDAATCSFGLTYTTGSLVAGQTITIASEAIYVSSISGSSVTGCSRGYASTTAAPHTLGDAFTAVDHLHLGTAGNTIVAQQLNTWIRSHITSTVPTMQALADIAANPTPISSTGVLRFGGALGLSTCSGNLCVGNGTAGNSSGVVKGDSAQVNSFVNASNLWRADSGGLKMGSAMSMLWSSTTASNGTPDVGIVRSGVGIFKVTDGSTGQGTFILKPPTSCSGMAAGTLWNDAGTPKICP